MFNLNNTIHYFLVQAEQICVGVSVTVRNGIHLHQLQPQTHETASYQKRRYDDVCKTPGGRPFQTARVRFRIKQLFHGIGEYETAVNMW